MRRVCLVVSTIVFALLFAMSTDAQQHSDGIWSDIAESAITQNTNREITPRVYRTLSLNLELLRQVLSDAPMEFTPEAENRTVVLDLPLPDGMFSRFRIEESPIMEPELAVKYPEIRTYIGLAMDDRALSVRFDLTPTGFHALIFTLDGSVYIDPYSRGNIINYISYNKRDAVWDPSKAFVCEGAIDDLGVGEKLKQLIESSNLEYSGTHLCTYRTAVAATGEYTTYHGGTVALGLAAVTTAMNRVNAVYQRDVAVRMVLVANNNLIIYTNAATDPYTNNNGDAMLGQNQTNLDNVIGNANYDVGHVFSTGGGGVANLSVSCVPGWKARGVSGLPAPIGDPFYVDYVAHEIGHQFGAEHTFNGNAGSCSGNRSASNAYEPGSGTTILAYAGICGAQNIQANSDNQFHINSIVAIVTFTTSGSGNNCPVTTATGNSVPVVTMPSGGFTIPINTPFELTGSATDANGDALTYCWEQYDLGAAGHPDTPVGDAPIFRSFSPVTSGTRSFPRLSNILNNTQTMGELLPSYTRNLTFRLTVRDNRANGGGVAHRSVAFSANAGAGPFVVTSPNTAVTWAVTSNQTVTWNVANTNVSPVNVSHVNIRLSTNGGNTFPITLVANTPNDGSQLVTIPNIATTQARVRVEAVGNVFFDLSNTNFIISRPPIQVTVDQRRELDQQLTGTQIGRWEGGPSFVDYTVPIPPFNFTVGSMEALRGMQDLVFSPTEKYNRWIKNLTLDDPDVKNHRQFLITSDMNNLTSRFKQTHPTVTIRTDLIDAPGTTGGNIQFHDPWYIDFQDGAYGSNWRNRGMQEARYLTRSLTGQFANGWQPDFTTTYPESPQHPYRGVFLGQEIAPGLPYYSVGAPKSRRVGNFPRGFIEWTGTSAVLGCSDCLQSPVVFQASNAVVTANYSYQFKTFVDAALSYNNQRKLVADYHSDPITPPNATHLVYDSAGVVRYASSTDAGQTWEFEEWFSGDDLARDPSIDIYKRSGIEHPLIVFQNNYTPAGPAWFEIWGASRRYRTWEDPPGGPYIWRGFTVGPMDQFQGSLPAKPALAFPFLFFLQSDGGNPGYYFSLSGYDNWRGPSFPPPERVPHDMKRNAMNLSVIRALYSGHPTARVDTVHLAWEENGVLKYRRVVGSAAHSPEWGKIENVSSKTLYGFHSKPSIAVDHAGRASVAWEYTEQPSAIEATQRQIRYRRREPGGWGITTAFSAKGRNYFNPSLSRFASSHTSNELALAWETDRGKILMTRHTTSWHGVHELPEPGTSPAALGYQHSGAQMFAFVGTHASHPVGLAEWPAVFANPEHPEVLEAELEFDDAAITVTVGDIDVEESPSRHMNPGNRRIKWRAVADSIVVGSVNRLAELMVSEPFIVQAGDSISSFIQVNALAGDSLRGWSRGGKLEITISVVTEESGRLMVKLGTYTFRQGVIPRFKGRKKARLDDIEGPVQLKISMKLTGGMNVNPNLIVHRRWEDMPSGESMSKPTSGAAATLHSPGELPTVFALHPNYPNPFNPSTTFTFDLPEPATVSLVVYDLLGRQIAEVVSGRFEAGYHSRAWNATGVASSGVYFARFTATDAMGMVKHATVSKLVLMK